MENVKKENQDLQMLDILMVGLRHWLWFLISVVICLGLSYLYIKKSPKIYQRQATVLIKNDSQSGRSFSESAVFDDLGFMNGTNNVNNEISIFKSKRLMIEVARRLNLDVDYYRTGKLSTASCYASTPVKLKFLDAKESDLHSLVMNVKSDNEIILKNFDETHGKSVTAKIDEVVSTPIGRIQPVRNSREGTSYGVDIHVDKLDLESVGIRYSNDLHSQLETKGTSIVTLALSDMSPERAEDVLNTLIQVYSDDAIEDKNRVTRATEEFIMQQLEELEGDLNIVDSKISEYKASHQLTNLDADAGAFRTMKTSQEQKVLDLQSQKAIAQYILDFLGRPSNGYSLIPSNTGLNNAQAESYISQYNAAVIRRDKIVMDAGESNPQLQDIDIQLTQLREHVVTTIRNLIQSINIQLNKVSQYNELASDRLTAVPGQMKTVKSVERQQDTKEHLYLYLLNKRQENLLAKNMTTSNARVIDPAMGSKRPVSPRPLQIMLIGLLMGLAIPAVIIYLLINMDTKVRSRSDVEAIITAPFLGEVPLAIDPKTSGFLYKLKKLVQKFTSRNKIIHRSRNIVVSKGSSDPVSEAIRILRTNLQFMDKGGEAKVLMTTSYIPSAGKTFVCSNLGMSIALSGKKVIMVDLDIRRGSLSRLMPKSPIGVTNYLGGYVDNIDDIIKNSGYNENLDIIPAGIKAPNPAELLMRPALDKLIDELKKRYDYVLLDNVPAQVVADAVIVSRVADLTLFVIRPGNLDRRLLPEIEQFNAEGKLKNMCIVLNGVKEEALYSRYYGYGYNTYKYKY